MIQSALANTSRFIPIIPFLDGKSHQDHQPANVMVGRYGEVVLMDWGLAKLRKAEDNTPESPYATQEGMVLGTPAYMAPEQALGHNSQVDERSDIYSASVLFHELLAVRHYLAHCKDQRQLTASVLSERFPYMRLVFIRNARHPVPPAELLHVIAKGLAKDADARYQNVRQMLTAMQRIRGGRCPVSCPATLAKRLTDNVGRQINRYPKLSPFLFYPTVLMVVASLLWSASMLVGKLL